MVALFAVPAVPTVLHSSMSKQGPVGLPKLKQQALGDAVATTGVQPDFGDLRKAQAEEGAREPVPREQAARGPSGDGSLPPGSAAEPTASLPAAAAIGHAPPADTGSPADVTALHDAAAADSAQTASSSDPATPPGASMSGGASSVRGGGAATSARSPSPSSASAASAADLALALAAADALAAVERADSLRRGTAVEVAAVVARLAQRPLTGQVVAWGWDAASTLSASRRTMPAQLFSALWPATEACVYGRMMPQDVLEVLESWLTLLQQCPRHFRLSAPVLGPMAAYSLPAAVKRMSEKQLAQLAQLARDIALHRSDAEMQTVSNPVQQGASARDLMQPVFALAAAEVAWRCANPARYVSPETVSAVLLAAPAWSWQVVRHRDRQALAALKLATAAALRELLPHSPRDLQRSPVLAKLRMGGLRGGAAPGDGGLRRHD